MSVVAGWLMALALQAAPPDASQDFVDMPEAPAAEPVEDQKAQPAYLPGYARALALGLSPLAPQLQPSLPGALTPAFGATTRLGTTRLRITGYVQGALRMSVGQRDNAASGQRTTPLHADPVVPGAAYGFFNHAGAIPNPWTELAFTYGSDVVTATVSLAAWSVAEADAASGAAMPEAQLWLASSYLTYTPDVAPVHLQLRAGVFPERYGFMGREQQGAYGQDLIADISGAGVSATLALPFEGDVTVTSEAGFKGQLAKAPLGTPPEGGNDYARAEEGSTFAAHAHLGVGYLERYTLALHFVHSFSQDDRKDGKDALPDGTLQVLGANLRLDAHRFGYLYVGVARTRAEAADALTDLVKVPGSGGYELDKAYFGFASGGSGTLRLVGGQYTVSLGTLLRYPMGYFGEGPDLSVSLFGVAGTSASSVERRRMRKLGGEVVYTLAEHFAVAGRVDRVEPDLAHAERSFSILSPRVIVRSGWLGRASLLLQYSRYLLGADVRVQGDRRLVSTTSQRPDWHLLALMASLWW